MSIPAFAWALEHGRDLKLLTADRMVLVYLANKATGDPPRCFPGQPMIEEYTGLAERTVRTSLHRLAFLQLIRAEQTHGKPTTYTILCPAAPANGTGGANGTGPAIRTPPPRQSSRDHPGNPDGTTPVPNVLDPLLTRTEPPANLPPILKEETKEETKTRAHAREGQEGSHSDLEEKKDDWNKLSEAEVAAQRQAHIDAMPPGVAAVINSLGASLRHKEMAPGHKTVRSVNEQRDALDKPKSVKPAYLDPENLRISRRMNGIPTPSNAFIPPANKQPDA